MTARALLTSRSTAILGAALLVVACGRDAVTTPHDGPGPRAAVYGKAPPTTSVSVTSASPAFGDQGTTVDVHVLGSGFADGAQATWLLHGAADPAHVRTNKTTFVSSTEVVANITIASDAQLAFWDVQVALAGGKNGVGSEAFEVTAAQILGPGTTGGGSTVVGMNDQLQVVGFSTSANTQTAWIYDPSTGMVALGAGNADGIDPLGTFVVGADSRSFATAWIRQAGNSWLAQSLPQLPGSLGSTAYGASRLADGSALVVGWSVYSKKGGTSPSQAVAWRRSADGVWSAPQVYVTPPGFGSSEAHDVNPQGQVTGHLDVMQQGIVWDSPTTYTILDGRPARINQAGTLIVGQRQNSYNDPVYWWRDPVTKQWHVPGTQLPSLAGSSCDDGFALDVNDAGVIVGWSCAGSTKNATVWQLDLSGPSPVLVRTPTRLPGLWFMTADDGNMARAVSNTAPYVVAGSAFISKTQPVAVEWNLR